MPGARPTRSVGFLLVDRFPLMTVSAAQSALQTANALLGCEAYRWIYFSPDSRPVHTVHGFSVTRTEPLAGLAGCDIVLVCAGQEIDVPNRVQVTAVLRRAAAAGARICSVSGGAFILARAGLLDGYRCTVHWEQRPAFVETFPHIVCTDALVEVDRNRMTCAGGITSMEMILKIVEGDYGKDLATYIANQYHLDRMRTSSAVQRSGRVQLLSGETPLVRAAIDIMRAHIEEPLRTAEIADRLGCSARRLERGFRRDVGQGPARFYTGLRLERARELLLYSKLTVLEVALASGFRTSSYLAHCYRAQYGERPLEVRAARRRAMRGAFEPSVVRPPSVGTLPAYAVEKAAGPARRDEQAST